MKFEVLKKKWIPFILKQFFNISLQVASIHACSEMKGINSNYPFLLL